MKTLSKRQILALHDHLIAETGGTARLWARPESRLRRLQQADSAHAALTFLALTGIKELSYPQQELSDIFLKLASGEAEYEYLLSWIKKHDA